MIGLFLIIYLLVYFATAFVLPSYLVWKRTGINPVTFRKSDSAHDYIGRLFKVVLLVLTINIIVYAFFADLYPFLLPIWYLEHDLLRLIGILLLILSLLWTARAQIQMGDSWRIGIDEEKETELVRTGVFAYSRNPIFLGMHISLLGFFLVIPNAVTLLVCIAGYLLMQIQVRLEEEFLTRVHNHIYTEFKQSVRRWL